MKIERHLLDQDYLENAGTRFQQDWDVLPSDIKAAKRNPKNLHFVTSNPHSVFALGCVINAPQPQILAAMRLAAEGYTGLILAAEASQDRPVTVRLGDGEPVTYTSPSDESTAHIGCWMNAFYFNVLCGNYPAIQALCGISPLVLRRSSTRGPDYDFQYMQALQMYASGNGSGIVEKMLAAMHGTNPTNPDIVDADWTLYIDVPQLEVLIYLVTKDARFGEALRKAVELHKVYWSKTKDLRRSFRGFVSVELTALTELGRQQGLSFDVESPYLPIHLCSP